MKTVNQLLKVCLIGACLLFNLLVQSCSPGKQLEKSKQRVLLDPAARHDVFLNELERFPCANDSLPPIYRPGKIDTTPIIKLIPVEKLKEILVTDTTGRKKLIDSLNTTHSEICNDAIDKAYTKGARDAINKFLNQDVFIRRPDTALYTIVDRQLLKLKDDSIQSLLRQKAAANQNIVDLGNVVKKSDKERNYLLYYLIGSIALLVLTNGLWIYARIKRIPLPKL